MSDGPTLDRAALLCAKAICLVFGHRYQVAQEFSNYSRRVVCPDCRGDWAMNDDVRAFVPWSEEFTAMYQMQGKFVYNPWQRP